MPWYYAQNNQRFGPYTEQEFSNLVAQGTIAPDTLVWRDGMQNWEAFSQVQPQIRAGAMDAASPPAGEDVSDRPMVVCSSCHRAFPEDEVIQYQGAYVCASCKPMFVQRLREGATMIGEMRYAGFWIRFVARVVDNILLGIVGAVLSVIFGIGLGGGLFGPTDQVNPFATGAYWLVQAMSFAISISYYTYFVGRFGATPGKMACGLTIVTAEGQKVTYLRAFGRLFAGILSELPTLYIGCIIAAFDEQKRALHDHICSTRVVRK